MRLRGFSAFAAVLVLSGTVAAQTAWAAKKRQSPVPNPSPSPNVGEALPTFPATRASVSELRSSLLGLVCELERNPSLMGESQRDAAILKLLGSYRTQGIPGSATISESSYVKVIVSEVLKQFPRPCAPEDFAERDRTRALVAAGQRLTPEQQTRFDDLQRCNESVERTRIAEVRETPYDVLLDRALTAYLAFVKAGDTTSEGARLIRPIFSSLGPCLASRIIAVGEAARLAETDPTAPRVSCPLDTSTDLPPDLGIARSLGGIAQLFFARFLTCPLRIHVPGDCKVRQLVYDRSKALLMRERDNPEVQNFQNQAFNEQIRATVLKELNTRLQNYNEDVAAKTGGKLSALLVPGAPLIERPAEAGEAMTFRDFVQGFHADIASAVALHRSTDPLARGTAGALLFAAANRALLVVGGNRAVVENGQWKVTDTYDAANPGRIPVLAQEPFGGIGAARVEGGVAAAPWDLGGYTPTSRGADGTFPFQLFPSAFLLDPAGRARLQSGEIRATTESLRDMADFLLALTYFLKVTGPGGELARYFVPQENFASELGDRTKPALFPKQGRELLYGLAAVALQNMAAPFFENPLGHLELVGTELRFRDTLSLDVRDPRMSEPATTLAVSRMLMAAKEFRRLIGDPSRPNSLDPDLPAGLRSDLTPIISSVDSALLFGHTQLAARNPCPDGGFGSRISGGCQPVAGGNGRALEDTVNALRAITVIYNDIEQEVVIVKIRQAWEFMDSFWRASPQGSVLPVEVLGLSPQPVQASRMWALLALWHETGVRVRGRLGREINWSIWESRMEGIKRRLVDQLGTPEGPQPLVP